MKKCLTFALVCLAGCAGAPGPSPLETSTVSKTNYGVFVGVGPAIEEQMAEEAAQQLWQTYPPPKNLLDFRQRIAETDSFGSRLSSILQREGYFVHRGFDPSIAPQCGAGSKKNERSDFRIVPVCYLIDDVSGMLRITLYTAGVRWSRLFETNQGKLKPVGTWTQGQ
ncbi:MAG: hypothetical protein LBV29_01365 [Azoarcus sp.]|jgi:hypothetical protein|nr:hypothetical protein [Azoarcus sp.]